MDKSEGLQLCDAAIASKNSALRFFTQDLKMKLFLLVSSYFCLIRAQVPRLSYVKHIVVGGTSVPNFPDMSNLACDVSPSGRVLFCALTQNPIAPSVPQIFVLLANDTTMRPVGAVPNNDLLTPGNQFQRLIAVSDTEAFILGVGISLAASPTPTKLHTSNTVQRGFIARIVTSAAQAASISWIRTFGCGATQFTIDDMVFDGSQSLYVSGSLSANGEILNGQPFSIGSSKTDVYLMKVSTSGVLQGTSILGVSTADETFKGLTYDAKNNLTHLAYVDGTQTRIASFNRNFGLAGNRVFTAGNPIRKIFYDSNRQKVMIIRNTTSAQTPFALVELPGNNLGLTPQPTTILPATLASFSDLFIDDANNKSFIAGISSRKDGENNLMGINLVTADSKFNYLTEWNELFLTLLTMSMKVIPLQQKIYVFGYFRGNIFADGGKGGLMGTVNSRPYVLRFDYSRKSLFY